MWVDSSEIQASVGAAASGRLQSDHSPNVPPHRYQTPLAAGIFQSSQQELREPHHRFDDAEHRLGGLFAQCIEGPDTFFSVVSDYSYDGRGQRVAKTAGSVITHYFYGLSGKLLGEYPAGSAGESIEYVYLNDQPVAVTRQALESVGPETQTAV